MQLESRQQDDFYIFYGRNREIMCVNRGLSSELGNRSDAMNSVGDVATRENIQTWTVGTSVPNQQVGNTWAEGGGIVSLSLSGVLNVFDQREGSKVSRILHVGPAP